MDWHKSLKILLRARKNFSNIGTNCAVQKFQRFFFVSKISIPRKIRLAKQERATVEGRCSQT